MAGPIRTMIVFVMIAALCSCATRSISDSGRPGAERSNPYYAGELDEMDVLGQTGEKPPSDAEIKQAMDRQHEIKLRKGSSLIVIQSGALSPDEPMLDELKNHFAVVPFSGVPSKQDPSQYSKRLRMAAAQGGYSHILCYWGTLETATEDKATKALSWVPVAGAFIPDEAQRMRIRLKAALIDVGSGGWKMITPDPIDDSALSSDLTRVKSDRKQVAELKKRAYSTLVSELSRYFTL